MLIAKDNWHSMYGKLVISLQQVYKFKTITKLSSLKDIVVNKRVSCMKCECIRIINYYMVW